MLDRIEEAIEEIRRGRLVIVVDDEDRENEGDFITAARNATPEVINFMSKYGRGLICAPLIEERCDPAAILRATRLAHGGFREDFPRRFHPAPTPDPARC